MSDATDVIIGSTTVVVLTTVIRKTVEKNQHPTAKVVVGQTIGKPVIFGFLLVMSLLVISFALPTFAKGLAYLSLVGAFVVNGPTLFAALEGIGR